MSHERARAAPGKGEEGNLLVVAVIIVLALAGLAAAFMETGVRTASRNVSAEQRTRVLYIAEAGANDAIADLANGGKGLIGSAVSPVAFGGGTYFAFTVDHGDGSYTVTSVAELGGERRAIEIVLAPEKTPIFSKALFGDLDLGAHGSVTTDSYDSEKGPYADQATNVHAKTGLTHAGVQGSLGSNRNIIIRGSVVVLGDATPGSGYSVTVSGTNVHIEGSTAPAPSATMLPTVKFEPPPGSPTAFNVSSKKPVTISAGTYHYSSFRAQAKTQVIVTGDVVLYIDGAFSLSGQASIEISPGASLTVYHLGDSFSLTGGGMINKTQLPSKFRLFTEATTVKFAGNSEFYGAVYAPRAAIKPTGTTDIYGSFVGRSIDIGGTANFHFDEALSRSLGSTTKLKRVSFRRVAAP